MEKCKCRLCKARELNCHPWEIFFGRDSIEAELIRTKPGLEIYQYEVPAKDIRTELEELKKEKVEAVKASMLGTNKFYAFRD